jgi:signal transduction histidine kinase
MKMPARLAGFDPMEWQPGWRRFRGLLTLAAATWIVVDTKPHPAGFHGRGAVLLAVLVIADLAWLGVLFLDGRPKLLLAGCWVCLMSGVGMLAFQPFSGGLIYLYAVPLVAGRKLPVRRCAELVGTAAVAFVPVSLLTNHSPLATGVVVLGLAVSLMASLIRRQVEDRQAQTKRLLAETQRAQAETQRAHAEQAKAAALTERARLAREIHDVLAHTLTALAVQLETIDALLENDRVGQARETVTRAQTLTHEGLAETRRAISALRDDPLPLPQLLKMLGEAYLAGPSTVEVEGAERDLSAEAGLTLYRTAQEAVTNVRKHSPGASITFLLAYRPEHVALTIDSVGGREPAARSTAYRVGGYGLIGLRERAELAGASFQAGPLEGRPGERGWRVSVTIPT